MNRWDKNIQALSAYVAENGTALVPTSYKCLVDGETVSLGSWVTYVRIKYRAGTLQMERMAQMENFPGWTWGPCKPGPMGNPDRDKQMVAMRQAGKSLQSIGDEYGLSRQRVHQILNRMGHRETASA
jgi:Mor family transcriptional regulator